MWMILALFLWPIIIFLIISLIILPFHFTFYSLLNIITVPFQLIKIAFNKVLRANHALEHATINVLEGKYGYQGLAGLANEKGFVIQGAVDPHHLEMAAVEGLRRLQKGEYWMAIHDRCGTSILAANFVAAVIFLILLWQTGMFTLLNVILAVVFAQVIGPVAGKIFQKFITTSIKVQNLQIVGVEYQTRAALGIFGFPVTLRPREFFVRTRRVPQVMLGS
ncbi:MAG: hypothetical protein D5R97_01510 [Candidatus Syntrophonatronum acetioxidans]|uniref:Uncharacterized protein n=1 Tax=Candidatus Syntrophonatronum acetioxidans TaxID=1795816 RepID=A0A424YHU5_9FIRM|nr:MAG: hypothetical protein D5R97_01510 [Candidatus Syntrophonatronum acetioxidans]